VNGDLVQGVEPSPPSRNRGRRRSRGQNRRRSDRVDVWRLPPRRDSKARRGATAVHEGEAFASFAAWGALVPTQGESPPMRNGPCRWKALWIEEAMVGSRRRWGKRSRQLSPGRAHAKAWTPPTENRSGRSDKGVRGWPHRPHEEEHASFGQEEPRTGPVRLAEVKDRVP
jgi:hypothetical protein